MWIFKPATGCIFYFQGNEAIRYLEFCVQVLSNQDQAIHNYLISLYAKLQPEDQLLKYLHFQGPVSVILTHWSLIVSVIMEYDCIECMVGKICRVDFIT